MKKFIVTSLLLCAVFTSGAQDIVGKWYGTLAVGGVNLRLAFDIQSSPDGYLTVMDSPDQGATGIPTTATVYSDGKLKISADDLRMVYEAVVKNDALDGTFRQGGMSVLLKLSRKQISVNRPQMPAAPFPYRVEDVRFENAAAGITLAGTLTAPQGKGKFPAVVLVSGSGAQNRDEEIAGHKPFLVLADYLTRRGIAVLRYDDRGFAESQGDYSSASIQDFASDALSAVRYLASRPDIDRKKIGVAGHSEGGMIVYMLAGGAGNKDIAFIVSMAGPVVSGAEVITVQRRLISDAMGLPEETVRINEEFMTAVNSVLEQYSPEYIRLHADSLAGNMIPESLPDRDKIKEVYVQGLEQISSPEMISLMYYDPTEDIANITCPILAVGGMKDLQVPVFLSLEMVEGKARSTQDVTVTSYEGLNHLFQHTETGLPTEYGAIEETFSEDVLKDIADWIRARVK